MHKNKNEIKKAWSIIKKKNIKYISYTGHQNRLAYFGNEWLYIYHLQRRFAMIIYYV